MCATILEECDVLFRVEIKRWEQLDTTKSASCPDMIETTRILGRVRVIESSEFGDWRKRPDDVSVHTSEVLPSPGSCALLHLRGRKNRAQFKCHRAGLTSEPSLPTISGHLASFSRYGTIVLTIDIIMSNSTRRASIRSSLLILEVSTQWLQNVYFSPFSDRDICIVGLGRFVYAQSAVKSGPNISKWLEWAIETAGLRADGLQNTRRVASPSISAFNFVYVASNSPATRLPTCQIFAHFFKSFFKCRCTCGGISTSQLQPCRC